MNPFIKEVTELQLPILDYNYLSGARKGLYNPRGSLGFIPQVHTLTTPLEAVLQASTSNYLDISLSSSGLVVSIDNYLDRVFVGDTIVAGGTVAEVTSVGSSSVTVSKALPSGEGLLILKKYTKATLQFAESGVSYKDTKGAWQAPSWSEGVIAEDLIPFDVEVVQGAGPDINGMYVFEKSQLGSLPRDAASLALGTVPYFSETEGFFYLYKDGVEVDDYIVNLAEDINSHIVTSSPADYEAAASASVLFTSDKSIQLSGRGTLSLEENGSSITNLVPGSVDLVDSDGTEDLDYVVDYATGTVSLYEHTGALSLADTAVLPTSYSRGGTYAVNITTNTPLLLGPDNQGPDILVPNNGDIKVVSKSKVKVGDTVRVTSRVKHQAVSGKVPVVSKAALIPNFLIPNTVKLVLESADSKQYTLSQTDGVIYDQELGSVYWETSEFEASTLYYQGVSTREVAVEFVHGEAGPESIVVEGCTASIVDRAQGSFTIKDADMADVEGNIVHIQGTQVFNADAHKANMLYTMGSSATLPATSSFYVDIKTNVPALPKQPLIPFWKDLTSDRLWARSPFSVTVGDVVVVSIRSVTLRGAPFLTTAKIINSLEGLVLLQLEAVPSTAILSYAVALSGPISFPGPAFDIIAEKGSSVVEILVSSDYSSLELGSFLSSSAISGICVGKEEVDGRLLATVSPSMATSSGRVEAEISSERVSLYGDTAYLLPFEITQTYPILSVKGQGKVELQPSGALYLDGAELMFISTDSTIQQVVSELTSAGLSVEYHSEYGIAPAQSLIPFTSASLPLTMYAVPSISYGLSYSLVETKVGSTTIAGDISLAGNILKLKTPIASPKPAVLFAASLGLYDGTATVKQIVAEPAGTSFKATYPYIQPDQYYFHTDTGLSYVETKLSAVQELYEVLKDGRQPFTRSAGQASTQSLPGSADNLYNWKEAVNSYLVCKGVLDFYKNRLTSIQGELSLLSSSIEGSLANIHPLQEDADWSLTLVPVQDLGDYPDSSYVEEAAVSSVSKLFPSGRTVSEPKKDYRWEPITSYYNAGDFFLDLSDGGSLKLLTIRPDVINAIDIGSELKLHGTSTWLTVADKVEADIVLSYQGTTTEFPGAVLEFSNTVISSKIKAAYKSGESYLINLTTSLQSTSHSFDIKKPLFDPLYSYTSSYGLETAYLVGRGFPGAGEIDVSILDEVGDVIGVTADPFADGSVLVPTDLHTLALSLNYQKDFSKYLFAYVGRSTDIDGSRVTELSYPFDNLSVPAVEEDEEVLIITALNPKHAIFAALDMAFDAETVPLVISMNMQRGVWVRGRSSGLNLVDFITEESGARAALHSTLIGFRSSDSIITRYSTARSSLKVQYANWVSTVTRLSTALYALADLASVSKEGLDVDGLSANAKTEYDSNNLKVESSITSFIDVSNDDGVYDMKHLTPFYSSIVADPVLVESFPEQTIKAVLVGSSPFVTGGAESSYEIGANTYTVQTATKFPVTVLPDGVCSWSSDELAEGTVSEIVLNSVAYLVSTTGSINISVYNTKVVNEDTLEEFVFLPGETLSDFNAKLTNGLALDILSGFEGLSVSGMLTFGVPEGTTGVLDGSGVGVGLFVTPAVTVLSFNDSALEDTIADIEEVGVTMSSIHTFCNIRKQQLQNQLTLESIHRRLDFWLNIAANREIGVCQKIMQLRNRIQKPE